MRNRALRNILDLLIEHNNGRLRFYDKVAYEHTERYQNPFIIKARKLASEIIADRHETHVDAREEKCQSDKRIDKSHDDLDELLAAHLEEKYLEYPEKYHDREYCRENLLDIFGQLLSEYCRKVARCLYGRNVKRRICSSARAVSKAEHHDGYDGTYGAERYETEAVSAAVFVFADGAQTDTECHDKRNGHGTRGNAARVKGYGKKALGDKSRRRENHRIADDEHFREVPAEKTAQKGEHEEKAHSSCHR